MKNYIIYKNKYLKYKNKYLKYKILIGGYKEHILCELIKNQPKKINKYCKCIITDIFDNIICEGNNTYENITIHAEMNCVKFLIKNKLLNSEINLYLTKSPCIKCFYVLKNLNIKNIYYFYEYEDDYRNYYNLTCINNYEIDKSFNVKLIDNYIKKTIITPLKIFNRDININIDFYNDNNEIITELTNDVIKHVFILYKNNFLLKKIIYKEDIKPLIIEKIFFIIMNIEFFTEDK